MSRPFILTSGLTAARSRGVWRRLRGGGGAWIVDTCAVIAFLAACLALWTELPQ